MKNSTKSEPNKSGLKDAANGASPASWDTDSDCGTIDLHYSNDDSTSQDTLNRKNSNVGSHLSQDYLQQKEALLKSS